MIVALRPPFACVERDAPSRTHHHRHAPRPPAQTAPSAPVPGALGPFRPWCPGPPAPTDGTGRTPSPCAHTGRQKHSARLTTEPATPLGTFDRGFVQPWNADNVK
jgi:hypothetical protein